MFKRFKSQTDDVKITAVQNGSVSEYTPEEVKEISKYLERVFCEKAYAEYIGGTIFMKLDIAQEGCDAEEAGPYFLNIEDEKLNPLIRYWTCLCYIKYKGNKNTEKYNYALKYTLNFKNSDESVVKHLLMV